MNTVYTERESGKIKNLALLTASAGWAWGVVTQVDWSEDGEEIYRLVEYHTNDAGEGLWVTGKDYDGSTKYTQIEGTGQFATAYGSQTRSAIMHRLSRYFAV